MAALLVAHGGHGHRAERRDADLVADDSARKGRRADLSRQAIRARDQPVSAQIRERVAGKSRRADRTAAAAEEIQGPAFAEQGRRISAAVSAESEHHGPARGRTGRRARAAARGSGSRDRPARSRLRDSWRFNWTITDGPMAPSSASRARTPGSRSGSTKARTATTNGSSSAWSMSYAGWSRGVAPADAAAAARRDAARRSRRGSVSGPGEPWRFGGGGSSTGGAEQGAPDGLADPSPQR